MTATRAGTLQLFVGGDATLVERHRALLEVLAGPARIIHVGGHGACAPVRLSAVWVYRQRAEAPGLNRGKVGRMQPASGKGLCGRSARLAGRVWRDGE